MGQVEFLDEVLAQSGHPLDGVLELTVDEEAVVGRMLKRAKTEGRADDTEEVIRERQSIYRAETKPLLDIYEKHGVLVKVDGMGTVDEVTDRLAKAVEALDTGRD